jgi:hypothetical protein
MPASRFAPGNKAWGLCQRCLLRFYLSELVFDGYMPGLRVCSGCYDDRQPQEFPVDVTDPVALWKPSPDSVLFIAPVLTLVQVGPPVKLAWTVADFGAYTVGSYSVYRAIHGQPFVLLATFLNVEHILQDGKPPITETLSYEDSAVIAGTLYDYYVQANSL